MTDHTEVQTNSFATVSLQPKPVLDLGGFVTDLVALGEDFEGASGQVFKGRYNDQVVAVKKSKALTIAAQMEQMDEIKRLAALPPHPNVLSLLGAYLEDKAVCSVSPFSSFDHFFLLSF